MKKISLAGALSLVIGNIIGVGIFTTTGVLAGHVVSPLWLIAAWLVGGWYAFSGGMVYGFLAQRMPFKGGDYVYLKRYFHPYWSYLFGWSALVITYTGSIAALSIGAAHYLNALWPALHLTQNIITGLDGIKLTALLLIVLFTYINHRGLSSGTKTQLLFSVLIVLMILSFIFGGWLSAGTLPATNAAHTQSVSEFFKALPLVLFTYMGWTVVVYIADEIKRPERNIPLSIGLGVGLVTLLYVGLNLIFVYAAPLTQLAGKINVSSFVAQTLWGTQVRQLVALMIFVAIVSSLNSTILSGPHIYKAMADDGFLLKQMAVSHRRFRTPSFALWIQAGWAVLLLFSGTFEELLTMVVAAILLFSLFAGVVAVKVLVAEEYQSGGWRRWFFVVSYLLLCFLILAHILYAQLSKSLIGFLILSLSYPFYFLQRGKNKSPSKV